MSLLRTRSLSLARNALKKPLTSLTSLNLKALHPLRSNSRHSTTTTASDVSSLRRFPVANDGVHVPRYGSFKVQVVKGQEYYWCRCGRSQFQPFCDGSHNALTDADGGLCFEPVRFEAPRTKIVGFCGCKHTKREDGLCDGSHRALLKEHLAADAEENENESE